MPPRAPLREVSRAWRWELWPDSSASSFLVVGSGALATAVAAAIGTGAAGIVTGGVIGYLKDLGVAEPVARDFADVIKDQGALLTLETDELEEAAVMGLLHKYGASRIEFFKVEVHA